MKKIPVLILCCTFWINPLLGLAQDRQSEGAMSEALNFKNPFKPLLPEKKKSEEPAANQTNLMESKSQVVTQPKFTVTGLVWNSDRPQAIIDSKVVGIGDEIGGSKIISIKKDAIEVLYQGKFFSIATDQSSGPH